eukprot:CAMPEP_0172068842 /NCGR_PEP_ID=MMETSP1043-20130122/12424_1 /TAXON_ID=464988 /ORGANISM="Hemiselmis andersenii, Strain CCMP441" /LENGTH=96 /DNA_ID=CAMNT_0012729123 /DNA_START=178 /DNA_END=465 /DNA_ORIENTATION=+
MFTLAVTEGAGTGYLLSAPPEEEASASAAGGMLSAAGAGAAVGAELDSSGCVRRMSLIRVFAQCQSSLLSFLNLFLAARRSFSAAGYRSESSSRSP